MDALQRALDRHGWPKVFNADQGVQFTSAAFTGVLVASGIRISMDGKRRDLDNIFIERLWSSLKCEDFYIKAYASVLEAPWHRRLAELLQRVTPASGAGLSDPMRGVPGAAGNLWIFGQRKHVDRIPSGPS